MIKAIVYNSNSGYTEQYAKILSEETTLPFYNLSTAKTKLEPGTDIVFLGWLMAGKISGYKKASKLFNIKAVCSVGMSLKDKKYTESIISLNKIKVPLSYLRGGYNLNKLKFPQKQLLTMVIKKMEQSDAPINKIENFVNKAQLQDTIETISQQI